MAASDTIAPEFVDLRTISSDWKFSCPTHGAVHMALVFNGELSRAICADCIEASFATLGHITAAQGAGPPVLDSMAV